MVLFKENHLLSRVFTQSLIHSGLSGHQFSSAGLGPGPLGDRGRSVFEKPMVQ